MLHPEPQMKWRMAPCLEAQPLLMKNTVLEAAGTRRAARLSPVYSTVVPGGEELDCTSSKHLVHSCLVYIKYQPSNLKVVAMSAIRHHASAAYTICC